MTNEQTAFTLWLWETPSHGKHQWAIVNKYSTKADAREGRDRMIVGRVTKRRLRITKGDAPPPSK